MGTFLKIGSPITGDNLDNISGYLPALGANGYDQRFRATSYALANGATITTPWNNEVGTTDLTTIGGAPKVKIDSLGQCVDFPAGASLAGALPSAGDRTVAFVVLGIGMAGADIRFFANVDGYYFGSTVAGFGVGKRPQGGTATVDVLVPLAPATGKKFIVLATITAAGAVTVRASKATEGTPASGTVAPTAYRGGTTIGAVSGSSSGVYTGVGWPRILTGTEQDAVIASLKSTYTVVD